MTQSLLGRKSKTVMPPSPLPSFANIRIDEGNFNDNNPNIIHPMDDNDDDKDDSQRIGRSRSRSMDDTFCGNNDKDLLWTTELEQENERLRTELLSMRNRLSRLKSKLKEQQQQFHQNQYRTPTASQYTTTTTTPLSSLHENFTTGAGGGIVLELPSAFRNKSERNGSTKYSPHIPNGAAKDHQSVSTTDDRSTLEAIIDLEAHQSGAGLHHRGPHGSGGDLAAAAANHRKVQITPNSAQPQLPKPSPKTDDSLSSSNSYDELERLVEAHAAMASTNRNNSSEPDGIVVVRNPPRTAGTGVPQEMTLGRKIADRAGWLVGLLVFQSLSSFILARNEDLLRHHAVIVQFLTMLVGAGGNAGNQASVGVVRGLAVGTIDRYNVRQFLQRELVVGVALSIIIGIAGFVRASVFAIPLLETMAITSSLFMIVIISVVAGALLPLGMQMVGIDPAHSSTTIQVIMDITGVVITVHVSSFVLDSDFRQWLENALLMDVEGR
ncbi:magnesium transporter [Nitzschia inconspicua]|uniref:Magnesium transporter n=1 Tax=Nitzschia inconspicua TaxID=303405 RepID=A0A9K3KUW9_9STRA|nr:magnesium transporter [Nitzschia inconspicua]